MENRINIAEILKDCPSGMELDCTILEGLEFDSVVDNEYLPIRCRIKNPNGGYNVYNFTKYGCYLDTTFAKCVIFPKGKTTWEGFQRLVKDDKIHPWTIQDAKDGDVIFYDGGWTCIFKCIHGVWYSSYCFITNDGEFHTGYERHAVDSTINGNAHPATKEQCNFLFYKIKEAGYKWNPGTKTLEELTTPKFEVGDRIKPVDSNKHYTIKNIEFDRYILDDNRFLKFTDEHIFELVPNKFDLTTLKPFRSRVLMRSSSAREWTGTIFSHYNNNKFYGCGMCCDQCIPYEGNEHLIGTTNDCNDYFKTWK